ncbi:hypothetical protein EDB87DRAFT_223078 [Lactarius vividus]|nr:hypothetical protein EDB87DRAFT_223078 [Lactarius vividus]
MRTQHLSITSNELQAAWDLYYAMWGQSLQDRVQKTHVQKDESEYIYLFRQEYIVAFDSLGLGLPTRRDSIIVTGHSGIAQGVLSRFNRLAALYFDEGGPRSFSEISIGTLALADSTPHNKAPSPVLLSTAKAQVVRFIQVTAIAGYLDEVVKLCWSEYLCYGLLFIRGDNILGLLKHDLKVLQRLYNAWGPSARNCMQISGNHFQGGYVDRVKTAVQDFVRKFQHSLT